MGFWCFVSSLTTSWVCASQSAKSIRSKREKHKGVEARGLPGCHGNMREHTLWFLALICVPGGLFSQGGLGFTELLSNEVTPMGVGLRSKGGIFSRFSLPMFPTLKQKARRRLLPKFWKLRKVFLDYAMVWLFGGLGRNGQGDSFWGGCSFIEPHWLMMDSLFLRQETERSGCSARPPDFGVPFLSKCQEMNSSVKSSPDKFWRKFPLSVWLCMTLFSAH